MDKSTNLQLWLPEDSDPLEVSKLSENFETLDGAIKQSAETSSGKLGDVTLSFRNLEEESQGKLIALDQRTIDMSAYPELTEMLDYYCTPYPVQISDKYPSKVANTSTIVYTYQDFSLNTSNIMYAFCYYVKNSTANASSNPNSLMFMDLSEETPEWKSWTPINSGTLATFENSLTGLGYTKFLRLDGERLLAPQYDSASKSIKLCIADNEGNVQSVLDSLSELFKTLDWIPMKLPNGKMFAYKSSITSTAGLIWLPDDLIGYATAGVTGLTGTLNLYSSYFFTADKYKLRGSPFSPVYISQDGTINFYAKGNSYFGYSNGSVTVSYPDGSVANVLKSTDDGHTYTFSQAIAQLDNEFILSIFEYMFTASQLNSGFCSLNFYSYARIDTVIFGYFYAKDLRYAGNADPDYWGDFTVAFDIESGQILHTDIYKASPASNKRTDTTLTRITSAINKLIFIDIENAEIYYSGTNDSIYRWKYRETPISDSELVTQYGPTYAPNSMPMVGDKYVVVCGNMNGLDERAKAKGKYQEISPRHIAFRTDMHHKFPIASFYDPYIQAAASTVIDSTTTVFPGPGGLYFANTSGTFKIPDSDLVIPYVENGFVYTESSETEEEGG